MGLLERHSVIFCSLNCVKDVSRMTQRAPNIKRPAEPKHWYLRIPQEAPHPKRKSFVSQLSTRRGRRIRLDASLHSLQSFRCVGVCVWWRQPSVISKRNFCNCQWKEPIKGDTFHNSSMRQMSALETKIRQIWEAQIWVKIFVHTFFFPENQGKPSECQHFYKVSDCLTHEILAQLSIFKN